MKNMNNLKGLINNYFMENIGDKNNVALLFSGGTDSLTCLFSLLELEIKPTLYSFHLESLIHKDIEVSKKVAEYYKLNHIIIEIPRNIEQLKENVKYLIKRFDISRKTNVQCTYPFLHVLPYVNEKYVVSGLCADDLYGTSKSMIINCSKNKTIFDEKRKKTFEDLNSSAFNSIRQLIEEDFNKSFLTPYRNNDVINFLMSFSWKELNKPKQKQIAVDSYRRYFEKQDIYRKNTNLQVGSGIREWHSELVFTNLNSTGRKRVDEIYKDIAKGLI
jgi:asparagine synthetase B (glutamine-hydrolysing)